MTFSDQLTLNKEGATHLYTGMVTDSGRFRYDCTTSRTFELASFLMRTPFDLNEIYINMYTDTFESKLLKAKYVLKIGFTQNKVAYIRTTKEELMESAAKESHTASVRKEDLTETVRREEPTATVRKEGHTEIVQREGLMETVRREELMESAARESLTVSARKEDHTAMLAVTEETLEEQTTTTSATRTRAELQR